MKKYILVIALLSIIGVQATVSSASQNKAPHSNSSSPIAQSQSSPTWLVNDLKIASQVKFPILVRTYALNEDETLHNTPKGFGVYANDVIKRLKNVWIGELEGTKSLHDYSYVFGLDFMKSLYHRSISNEIGILKTTPILVMEYNTDPDWGNGGGYFMPAVSIDKENGLFLAFAPNQVITSYEQDGVFSYTVFPIKGIKLPNLSGK